MGKLLKALTVLIFLLSIGALVMGIFNFSKRELLIGRTNALETKIRQLALTIEDKEPVFDQVIEHEERDIDEVTARPIDNPSRTQFWAGYNGALEIMATPMMNLDGESARQQLRSYYMIDKATGEVAKDFQGIPKTTGEGTMDELLSKVLENSKNQYNRLNATRQQLTTVRQELETVISELNKEKQSRRANLRTISELQAKIVELETEIARLNAEIARLEREKLELQDIISERDAEIEKKNEDLVEKEVEIKRLEAEIERLKLLGTPGGERASTVTLTPGNKGKVISVNPEWSFVIVQLTPEAVKEITATAEFAPVEMMVNRKEGEGSIIVTKLLIKNPPTADGVAIADNVYGWEQVPVQAGDDVVY